MLSINTNTSSLIAQNSLKTSTSRLNQAIERMSSGAKINHAKDNAANYSIATNMTTKINAYMVAEDNCAMGMDLVTTAEESLNLISDKLSRLRTLAEQANNGTYGEDSLKAINSECNALVDEINRIYETTEYNGQKLFKAESNPVNAISTYARSRAATTKTGFIQEISQRDTSEMTKLSSIDPTQSLASGTYSISTAEELAQLATMTNNGMIGENTEFVLANNIDLSAYSNWTPIGNGNWDLDNSSTVFKGTFDGNGYVISNLTITEASTDYYYWGLFGSIAGDIKNLGIEDAYIDISCEDQCIGGILAGVSVDLDNDELTYLNTSTIQNCYATGSIYAESFVSATSPSVLAGGLVGGNVFNLLKFDSCYSGVDIEVSGVDPWVGGLIGANFYAFGDIQNCYTTGNITLNASDTNWCGGLVGLACLNDGTDFDKTSIKNSFSTGKVTATGDDVGGLVGILSGYSGCMSGCYYNSANSKGIGDDDGYGVTGVTAKSESELKAMIPTLYKYNGTTSSGSAMLDFVLQIGTNGNSSSQISFNTSLELGSIESLRGIGVNPVADYLSKIDSMMEKVSAKQTEFGAVTNRLESALDEISTQYENLVSSRSTIMDADIAEVSAEYIKMQILQQASATLMATANQSPAIALQLL